MELSGLVASLWLPISKFPENYAIPNQNHAIQKSRHSNFASMKFSPSDYLTFAALCRDRLLSVSAITAQLVRQS